MSSPTYQGASHTHLSHNYNKLDSSRKSGFFVRFKKNIIQELALAGASIWFLLKLICIIILAVGMFLFNYIMSLLDEFLQAKEVLGFFALRILAYGVGTYLTLLPAYLVIAILFLPKNIPLMVTGVSCLASLFLVFLL